MRKFDEGMRLFNGMYFLLGSIYDEADFECRFRMPRKLFERAKADLRARGMFFNRQDATGKTSIHPIFRIICSTRPSIWKCVRRN